MRVSAHTILLGSAAPAAGMASAGTHELLGLALLAALAR